MNCVFCPDGNSKQPPPDVIHYEDYAAAFRITGLEPLNSSRFFDVLEEGLARAPGANVVIETTGLPLLDASLRARVAAVPNLTLLVPLYGDDDATNEAVTSNPHFFASVQALLATEVGPRIRFQTLAVRANIERFPDFLRWCAERHLEFGSLRVLLMRGSDRERQLYRDNVVSFSDLMDRYIGRVRHEPDEKFDGCFSALPLCVLRSAGIADKVQPWRNLTGKIAIDEVHLDCPHLDCALYDDCPKIPDVYREVHGLDGIEPVAGGRRSPSARDVPEARRLPVVAADTAGPAATRDGDGLPGSNRVSFGPLAIGAALAPGWHLYRIHADAGSPVRLQLRDADGGEVTLLLTGPGQTGDSGPFDLDGCRVCYGPTKVPFDRFRDAGMEVRRMLESAAAGEVDAACWRRWLDPA